MREVIDIMIVPKEAVMAGVEIVLMGGHQVLCIAGVQVLVMVGPVVQHMTGTTVQCMTGTGVLITEGMRVLNMADTAGELLRVEFICLLAVEGNTFSFPDPFS